MEEEKNKAPEKKAEEKPQEKPQAKAPEKPQEKPQAKAPEKPQEQAPPPAEEKKEEKKPEEAKKEAPKKVRVRTANCAKCNKVLKKRKWYYRNSKHYCNKRCWKADKAKAGAAEKKEAKKA